ncbi:PilZ domain-containing protein [Pontixanthobacter aestiaquae]|uniref:PilZ domain-containing protein n=1 Tax=Pontixanthobacter aestiaquae TaxID=1509367 RepID=A0A844Z4A1_9SPHN|nr:PilZ domain-containing protein [Pontixanthobacter aestiaquae]MDN3647097.1 PilZ domain-containing protein [Pontixanthobacter aestiaquae]MXO81927.1 PilZ domain-containing protein [Pontixanthobacter aestiaquae]
MSGVDTRNISRDSLFLMAEIRLDGEDGEHRVKVRNLSSGGMMAEGGPSVVRGSNVSIQLRNIGWVEGVIAWVQEERFGIAFSEEIDPGLARGKTIATDHVAPRFTRPIGMLAPDKLADRERLRNI